MIDSRQVMRLNQIIVALGVLISFAFGAGFAQNRAISQGEQPYTPTRLEWLAVDLNAQLRTDITHSDGYALAVIPIAGQNTLLIYVTYLASVDREVMNIGIESARRVIETESKSYGWNSWLKVREQIQLGNSTQK